MVNVHSFKVWDHENGNHKIQEGKRTAESIARIGHDAKPIPETEQDPRRTWTGRADIYRESLKPPHPRREGKARTRVELCERILP